jgi:hypothetical protein
MAPPLAVQFTAVLDEPVTVAVNCLAAPTASDTEEGLSEIATAGAGLLDPGAAFIALHAVRATIARRVTDRAAIPGSRLRTVQRRVPEENVQSCRFRSDATEKRGRKIGMEFVDSRIHLPCGFVGRDQDAASRPGNTDIESACGVNMTRPLRSSGGTSEFCNSSREIDRLPRKSGAGQVSCSEEYIVPNSLRPQEPLEQTLRDSPWKLSQPFTVVLVGAPK